MSKMTTDSEESTVQIILTMENYQPWLSYQRIRCKKLFGMQTNDLKNNVRYTYPVVTGADYTPPLEAPLNPVQLNKLRLKSEEDRNGRDQKLGDDEPRFVSTFLDSISVESQEIIRWRSAMGEYERIKRQRDFMAFHQEEKETLGAFKVDYMEKRATLTAVGIEAPAADEEALWFFMKLDRSRHGDMLNKLTNDVMRGTPWPATLDEAYLQASTWRVQAPRKGDGESESGVYVIADTMRKKKARQLVKKTLGSAETRKCFVCQKTGQGIWQRTVRISRCRRRKKRW